MSSAATARAYEAAAWPEDWGDDSPAGATPVETTTVSQLLPTIRWAAKFMVRGLGGVLLALLFLRWILT